MTYTSLRKIAIIMQVVFFAIFIVSLFIPKGDLKLALNISMIVFGLSFSAIAFVGRKKKWDQKKNLKQVRDELLEKRWEEEHPTTSL